MERLATLYWCTLAFRLVYRSFIISSMQRLVLKYTRRILRYSMLSVSPTPIKLRDFVVVLVRWLLKLPGVIIGRVDGLSRMAGLRLSNPSIERSLARWRRLPVPPEGYFLFFAKRYFFDCSSRQLGRSLLVASTPKSCNLLIIHASPCWR